LLQHHLLYLIEEMIHILFFVLCLVNSHDSHRVHGIQHTLEEDLELERQLQLINKSPLKSIHVLYIFIIFHYAFFFFSWIWCRYLL